MQIDKVATENWREMYNIPNSDEVEKVQAQLSTKRERGESTVVKERERKVVCHE